MKKTLRSRFWHPTFEKCIVCATVGWKVAATCNGRGLTREVLHVQDSVTVHTKIRPKDVPGTLLNMALLNLGSSDPNLRTAAYNLLCALTATFDLKIEGQLLETAGTWHACQLAGVLSLHCLLDALCRCSCEL